MPDLSLLYYIMLITIPFLVSIAAVSDTVGLKKALYLAVVAQTLGERFGFEIKA